MFPYAYKRDFTVCILSKYYYIGPLTFSYKMKVLIWLLEMIYKWLRIRKDIYFAYLSFLP